MSETKTVSAVSKTTELQIDALKLLLQQASERLAYLDKKTGLGMLSGGDTNDFIEKINQYTSNNAGAEKVFEKLLKENSILKKRVSELAPKTFKEHDLHRSSCILCQEFHWNIKGRVLQGICSVNGARFGDIYGIYICEPCIRNAVEFINKEKTESKKIIWKIQSNNL